jgi:hypothetical protein
MTMFDSSERDLARTLTEMERTARERSNFDQSEAKEKFREFLQGDRRFDPYDKDRLIDRVMECRSNGAVLDLSDTRLMGLEPRPLDRSRW